MTLSLVSRVVAARSVRLGLSGCSGVRQMGWTSARLQGNGEVAEICRLTCLEQGLSLVDDGHAPLLRVQDLKIYVDIEERY